ncbi:MAG: hypothetical protein MHMPM18_000304 [Marteilia pararefringens]
MAVLKYGTDFFYSFDGSAARLAAKLILHEYDSGWFQIGLAFEQTFIDDLNIETSGVRIIRLDFKLDSSIEESSFLDFVLDPKIQSKKFGIALKGFLTIGNTDKLPNVSQSLPTISLVKIDDKGIETLETLANGKIQKCDPNSE